MAKSTIAFLLFALVVCAAMQSAAADQTARKLMATQNQGCSSPPSGGFLFTLIIRATFWNHLGWLGNYQCCNGNWVNGGCHQGNCYWQGKTYSTGVWADAWQCCTGSWVRGGCNSGGSSNLCYYNGKQFSTYTWWEGQQCCIDGSFRSGGCGGRN